MILETIFSTTGAEPVQLRPEFRNEPLYHCDAPQFFPSGGADDGLSIAMIARHESVWDCDFL